MIAEFPQLTFPAGHIQYLASCDPRLGEYMETHPVPVRRCHPEPFPALIRTIAGQQISAACQDRIWDRLKAAIHPFTPENIVQISIDELRKCGVSAIKARNMKAIAGEFAAGRFANLEALSDEGIAESLLALPGVGPWTVEMMLLFTFRRPDIMSFGDLAIKRGLCRLHGHENITREIFAKYRELYSPCGSLASLYLWEIAALRNFPAGKATQSSLS